jgi:DNA-binding response OmpR family regulator
MTLPETKKIAIIDDERDLVHLASKRIKSAGYDVACCYDGRDAAQFIEQEKPALIILDIMLPGISGIDVFKNLRSKAQKPHIPVVFFSANPVMESHCLNELGAEGFITKPYNPNQFLALIETLLRDQTARN